LHTGIIGIWLWFKNIHLSPCTDKRKLHSDYNIHRRNMVAGRINPVNNHGPIVNFEIQERKGGLHNYLLQQKKRWQEEGTDAPIIRKTLTHLGLYMVRSRPPPRAPRKDFWFDSPYSQVPDSEDYLHADPEYSVDEYL